MQINMRALTRWSLIIFVLMAVTTGVLYFMQPGKGYEKVQAVITDVEEIEGTDSEGMADTDYRYFVDYTVDGKGYTRIELDISDPSYEVGKSIEVFYDPADPSVIRGDVSGMMLYTGIVAGASLAVFVVCFIAGGRRI